jgi:hypothetical protein
VIAAMSLETWDARTYTPAQAQAVGELIHQVWPKPNITAEDRAAQLIEFGRQRVGESGPPPLSIVVIEAGRLLAHAKIFPRVVGTERGEMLIGALAQVCTDVAMRGHGLGELVAREAFRLVDAGEYELSLFQTTPGVRPFYEKLGAVTVDNRIVNSLAENPDANPFWHEVVMR